MAYLTLCVEFSNLNISFGHIRDARAAYTTNTVGSPHSFALYPNRWRNENSRGTITSIPSVVIEDSLDPLSFDQGIKFFSTIENPTTFSFSIVDLDKTYAYLTKNQTLSGKVLIKYGQDTGAAEPSITEYVVALLDIYAVTYNNGIVKFECDSVSSWKDLTNLYQTKFFGTIVDKEITKDSTEELVLYSTPVHITQINDGRLPLFNGGAVTKQFFNTVYVAAGAGKTRIYLQLFESVFDTELPTLKKYLGKTVILKVVDGKGVGQEFVGTLGRRDFFNDYYLEIDHRKATPPRTVEVNDTEKVVDLDRSSYCIFTLARTIFDIADLDQSDITSIKTEINGQMVEIPRDYITFEEGRMIFNSTESQYHIALPLSFKGWENDIGSSPVNKLTSGDFDFDKPALSESEVTAIINDPNLDTFVGFSINNSYSIDSTIRFYFDIAEAPLPYVFSNFNNATSYVLNGKIQSELKGSLEQSIDLSYKWVDNRYGVYQDIEYDSGNYPISYPVKQFTASSQNWFTINRNALNVEYTGTVSAGEDFYTDQIKLELGDEAEIIKDLKLTFTKLDAGSSTLVRIYNLNIDAEYSLNMQGIDKVYITLNSNHPGSDFTTIPTIINKLYRDNVPGETTLTEMDQVPATLVLDKADNIRNIIGELASETNCCLYEGIDSLIQYSDFYYYKRLYAAKTWDYSTSVLSNYPISDIKSIEVNSYWANTMRLTTDDYYYQIGKISAPLYDSNDLKFVSSNDTLLGRYNDLTENSFQNDGSIVNIDKSIKYSTSIEMLLGSGSGNRTPAIKIGKTNIVKFVAPINTDILFYLRSRFIKTSHPDLFDNSVVTMRINKMDIDFHSQEIVFECFILDIQPNPEQVDFVLWFESPFMLYSDKVQDNMNNGNSGDWYVGLL